MDDYLGMSDADFEASKPPVIEDAPVDDSVDPVAEVVDAPVDEVIESGDDTDDNSTDDKTVEDPADTDNPTVEPDKADEPKAEDKPEAINYEAEHTRLLEPFTANGKQIKVDSVDEARRLMSMGAGYHKKMASLKPILKVAKLLEQNGLMDETKINYLIDLHTKQPAAITHLLKDANIDPHEVDMDTDVQYTPQARTVSDKELQLDEVLENIQDSPTYSRTLTVITKEWDAQSQSVLVNSPQLISTINEQVSNGDYDQVTALVERERALGNLLGMSDIDAYYTLGDQLARKGHLVSQQKQNKTESPAMSPAEKPAPLAEEVRRRKKSAAVTRTSPSVQSTEVPDILGMSDEEFAKLSSPPYKQVK